jgi:non-reducing end alpha-L-arabinofuranosidase
MGTPSRRKFFVRYFSVVLRINAIVAVIILLVLVRQKISAEPCPCDIYEAGGTPCVAAHSTVRALYGSYSGSLYQVKRTSDKQTKDIGVLTKGGYANAAAQDSFLNGKPGTISIIYDQSPQGNHLKASPIGGWLYVVANESNAADTSIQMNGHKVYGVYTKRGGGYRNNQATGIATGTKPESIYMVASGKSVNDSCCFDYGNVETNMKDNGTGTMETIYLGKLCWFGPCTGSGPWVFADLENGLFTGANGRNANNTSVPYDYVTAMVKGDATTYTIKAGDATTGSLKTMGNNTQRPAPQKLEGAIVLGLGGDNSWAARGIFFEGAMTAGKAPDTTEDAIQKNIIAAGYGNPNLVSTWYGANVSDVSPAPPVKVNYNPSKINAVISYTLKDARHVNMTIFDQRGRRIGSIVDGIIPAGRHKAVWDAKRVPAGVYIVRMTIDGRNGWAGRIIAGK